MADKLKIQIDRPQIRKIEDLQRKKSRLRFGEDGEILFRRKTGAGIHLYDLAYYKQAGEFRMVGLEIGGPLVRETAAWSAMVDAFNFPLTVSLNDWRNVFFEMNKEHVISAVISTNEGTFQENINFEDYAIYEIPANIGNPNSISFNNYWLPDVNSLHTFYENGFFESVDLFQGESAFYGYYTADPDPDSPQVSPNIDLTKEVHVYLAPKAVRATGTYYPDSPPGTPGGGGSSGPWKPMSYPQFTGNFFLVDPNDCPGFNTVYYRFSGGDLQFSLLPNGGVQPPFIVCGLGAQNPDGTYPGFSPEMYEFNSPTTFWDRQLAFDNYLEGTIEEDNRELKERMIANFRLQGGDNIKRINGVWSIDIGHQVDDLNISGFTSGGTGSSEPILRGAINQGSNWWFRWFNI